MVMVRISGKREKEPKRDIDGFRVKEGVLETSDESFYLQAGEKVMYNTVTNEVRIR
jgi:hypothetical protein